MIFFRFISIFRLPSATFSPFLNPHRLSLAQKTLRGQGVQEFLDPTLLGIDFNANFYEFSQLR